ncbi:TPA: hypothetical protein DDW69_00175 [candidate division CPR2 bacterium]|uniref:DUF998 domain-containing protein n=1 Tax=candidate division CPR2 bacterium GW2011_GWC1_41_48 TaxID=1618344 RepID=A0A0G0W9J0_UNCC2|nr:MAG: hypothetical protein UT47_C0005G0033 [candidate division CPR2 bacterium GW2011_GWC2_39_35]KKR28483.1 MAG: hypothetical protein UT60_C0019G0018 [candidate division CPR2 bacterium GW2011_GWD2_39_7]KKR29451.1 MAG: hypothetical protein UT59_C0007G0005 [candidate division CPR2 bacterium GW2011_GWD1_39_7]KKS08722.1 MAG: hypothetical protein UU65_C0005G0033 [candidate division CPR2 bacterium GW2011_GWC1_41_48]OGB55610.1 MAG: hypothetical protein A2Y27_03180 [candidate division CPR2 bacterium G
MKTKLNLNSGVALFTSVLTLLTLILAYNTPPLSGPFCRAASCFQYPYLDIASRFPRDYYWMAPAMGIVVAYLILMLILSNRTEAKKKLFGQLTVIFASMSTAIFLLTFFTQLSVIQPSLLKGEADGISLLTQFNPHGLFIALEELGFLLMVASFLFVGLAMTVKTRLEKWIKGIFIGGFALTILSLVIILATMGLNREYFFEVAAYSLTWPTLIINGFLLFKLFKKDQA